MRNKMKLTREAIMSHMPKIIRTVRVALCIIVAAFILFTVGIVNNVFKYVFARWSLDIIQNDLDTGIPFIYKIIVLIWNYVVGFVIIGLVWKYFAIPRVTVFGKLYKRYMDMYYEDDED